jgi:hypothetical protein
MSLAMSCWAQTVDVGGWTRLALTIRYDHQSLQREPIASYVFHFGDFAGSPRQLTALGEWTECGSRPSKWGLARTVIRAMGRCGKAHFQREGS